MRPKLSTPGLSPPAGMRDHLYPESVERQSLRRRLTDLFGRWGYELVTTPPFEHAAVLERGLDSVDRRDLLRFVEPESGEVALLRPDITPQVARVVATRLRDRPPPFRLCYEGWVIRQRRGRVRRPRQVAQAGVEHIGDPHPAADAEILSLCAETLSDLGLSSFRIELAHSRIVREIVASVPAASRAPLTAALAAKDAASLGRSTELPGVDADTVAALETLAGLWGDLRPTLEAARTGPLAQRIEQPLREIEAVVDRLDDGLSDRVGLDLGEHRGMAYYTGVSFSILCDGPGQPVGAGGRYDNLLARFGAPAPATGFALDVDAIETALDRVGGAVADATPRLVVFGGDRIARRAWLSALRRAICAADLAEAEESTALAFADAWHYDAVLSLSGEPTMTRITDRAQRAAPAPPSEAGVDQLVAWLRQEE